MLDLKMSVSFTFAPTAKAEPPPAPPLKGKTQGLFSIMRTNGAPPQAVNREEASLPRLLHH